MDISTLVGYVVAWGALCFGIWHASEGKFSAYIQPAEMIVVVGCAFGAATASTPLHSVMSAMAATKKLLFCKDAHIDHIIKELVQYAETARRDGVLALESVAREAPDPFLRRGLQLTIDGTDPEIIERIMRIEIESMIERHKHGKAYWGSIAKFGPGCGLIACLLAQVAMFTNLNGDPGTIGHALAGALTGTFYGCLLQNLVAGPMAEKLGEQSKGEVFGKEIILQGVLSIQAGNNPRVVEMQLMSFLSSKKQEAMPKAA